jgi:competence protein ComEC
MTASASKAGSSSSREVRYQPLVIILAAAAAGIAADRFWPLPLAVWWSLVVGGLAIWVGLRVMRVGCVLARTNTESAPASTAAACVQAHTLRTAIPANLVLLLVVAATAGAWHHQRWQLFSANDLGRYAGRKAQPICVEAVAIAAPRIVEAPQSDATQRLQHDETSRLEVDLLALRNGGAWQAVSGRATLVVAGRAPEIAAGDRLRVLGRLSAPPGPQNPGTSDYAAWLRGKRILSRLTAESPECVSVVQQGSRFGLTRALDNLRAHGNRLLEEHLDPRYAALAEGVLLGEREQIGPERIEDFMATGTIHMLVIAGLHLGILAAAMFWLLRRMPLSRGWTALIVSVVLVIYMLVVDAGPPVVRATVLVLVFCTAEWLGRRGLSFNSLAAAALVVLAVNPTNLFQPGAQLSFLSVAGLMWFAPYWTNERDDPLARLIARNLPWHERMRWAVGRTIRQLMLVSLTIWLLTMPLVMARFHLCTPVAVLLNTVAWLPMACSLLSGFALVTLGGLASPLAAVLGWFCNLNLWLLEGCVTTARRLPLAHFWLPGPGDWWLWGFYGGIGLLAAFPRVRPPRRWCVAILAGWIAVGFAAAERPRERHRLDCTFLSMGHGCAVLLELPSGQTILYDAGQMSAPTLAEKTISGFLWSRGLVRVDAVALSHPDSDHYNALPGLLKKFSVGAVYVSPVMFTKQRKSVAELREAIDRHKVPVRELRAGDRLAGGDGCRIEVLHPVGHGLAGPDNANSLVLAVEYQGRRILLAGDLESPGLDDVLAEEPLPCDVLLAPHHGSRKSNSPALAAWCQPRWVVFSSDGRWNVPQSQSAYRAIGSRVLWTCDGGAVHVQIASHGLDVSVFAAGQ